MSEFKRPTSDHKCSCGHLQRLHDKRGTGACSEFDGKKMEWCKCRNFVEKESK